MTDPFTKWTARFLLVFGTILVFGSVFVGGNSGLDGMVMILVAVFMQHIRDHEGRNRHG